MKFEQLLKVQNLFLLFCRCCHIECGVYKCLCVCVCARVSVYECVVICVHFPRFYGKPRCTQIYVHTRRCTNGSIFVFRFFSILPLLSPSHRICLYLIPILTLSFVYSLLISSLVHIFPNSMPHICISFIYASSSIRCALSHITSHHILLFYILYFQSCVYLSLYLFVLFCFSFCSNYYFRVFSLLLMLECTVDWLALNYSMH